MFGTGHQFLSLVREVVLFQNRVHNIIILLIDCPLEGCLSSLLEEVPDIIADNVQ